MGYLLTFDSARARNKGDESWPGRNLFHPRKCDIFLLIFPTVPSNRFPRRGEGVRRCRFCFTTFAFVSRLNEMKEDTMRNLFEFEGEAFD